ncbi:hypothetical protein PV10_03881 [Exophiala mesophila]|uniref:Cytochrome b561 domain-containing protein n=1 Tax=Exophiala mesophila TaxID=212818 RepID=A0A0D1ZD56_EXOME|nr:uncharacterized protein PV10_03881 [Exophiala mesophila]KIV92607.1 hypothetical protein PV10_03881 [Exophiala mesophila]
MASTTILPRILTVLALAYTANADWRDGNGGYGNWKNGDYEGEGPPWWGGRGGRGSNSTSNNDSYRDRSDQAGAFGSLSDFNHASRILIAHAVLASLVWVVFVPSLAILLRLNIKNPIVLKLHALGQIFSYIVYIAAAGLGIWLAQQSAGFGIWNDPHPQLGLAILAIAFFQPFFGASHHRIYKKRANALQAGQPTKQPGRTTPGRTHLWVGRILIVLGIVNGGLGIRLASYSPFQSDATSRRAGIIYGAVAAAMFVLYVAFVVFFEVKRARFQAKEREERQKAIDNKQGLPTYDESEESVGQNLPRYS